MSTHFHSFTEAIMPPRRLPPDHAGLLQEAWALLVKEAACPFVGTRLLREVSEDDAVKTAVLAYLRAHKARQAAPQSRAAEALAGISGRVLTAALAAALTRQIKLDYDQAS